MVIPIYFLNFEEGVPGTDYRVGIDIYPLKVYG